MNKLLTIIALGFCALVVLGALGVFVFVGVLTPTRVTVTPAPTPTVLTGSAAATTVTHDGLTVQASNLQQIRGGGQQSIMLIIKLTNQGTHSARYNALDFQLEDGTDHVRHDAADVIFPPSRSSGSMPPGEILSGTIVFRVPASEHRFTLVWTPTVAVPITR